MFPGVYGNYDFRQIDASGGLLVNSSKEAVDRLARDIHRFRDASGADTLIVAYLAGPHLEYQQSVMPDGGTDDKGPAPASTLYARAAVEAGAHFVDFTPSAALEDAELRTRATDKGLLLSGRDLSTGQTMLKAALIEMLARRNLFPSSWYSTNLIGNADGRALTTPGFEALKLSDKRAATAPIGPLDHLVRIDYMHEWGDNKESWDA